MLYLKRFFSVQLMTKDTIMEKDIIMNMVTEKDITINMEKDMEKENNNKNGKQLVLQHASCTALNDEHK